MQMQQMTMLRWNVSLVEAGGWGGSCYLGREARRNLEKVNHEKGENGEQKRGVSHMAGRNMGKIRGRVVSLHQQKGKGKVKVGKG